MSEKVSLHTGSIEDMGKCFIGAWYKLEGGEDVRETHLTFFSLQAMMATLPPKRLTLLRHLRQHASRNVAELARLSGATTSGFTTKLRLWHVPD